RMELSIDTENSPGNSSHLPSLFTAFISYKDGLAKPIDHGHTFYADLLDLHGIRGLRDANGLRAGGTIVILDLGRVRAGKTSGSFGCRRRKRKRQYHQARRGS